MSRRVARVDENQPKIVDAIRKIGGRVLHLHQVGHGCPDVLVAFKGRNVLLEIKRPREQPNAEQMRFIEAWGGELHVVHTSEEAIAALIGKEMMK